MGLLHRAPARSGLEMAQKGTAVRMRDIRRRLSTLWISVILFKLLYADVLGLLNPEFLRELTPGYHETAEGVQLIQPLLAGATVMVDIPIMMAWLSRVLTPTVNRRVNLAAIALTTAFIIGGGSTSPHYLFLAAVELGYLALILRQAWRWRVVRSPDREPANPARASPPAIWSSLRSLSFWRAVRCIRG
jgi:hypothetical protein